MRTRAYRFSGEHPAFPARWFTAYNALSPATGLFATVTCGSLHKLDASIGASGPHDFAVRLSAVRQWHIRVHRISPHVRDDRESPLLSGETRGERPLICPTRQAEHFRSRSLTGIFDLPVGQSAEWLASGCIHRGYERHVRSALTMEQRSSRILSPSADPEIKQGSSHSFWKVKLHPPNRYSVKVGYGRLSGAPKRSRMADATEGRSDGSNSKEK